MANSLNYLAGEVYNITRRPDLVAQTQQAIRTATLELHQRAFYPKDLQEFFIDFDEPDFIQQFAYSNYVPFWRALSYFKHPEFRQWNQQNVQDQGIYCGYPWQRTNKEFTVITPDNIFNINGFLKTDVCYLSGTNWNLRAGWKFQKVRCGCYVNPDVTVGGYSSWIADQHEFAVIFRAAQIIFKGIGLDAEAQSAEEDVKNWQTTVDTVNLVGVGG